MRIVRKIAVSLLLGSATYAITEIAVEDRIWSIVLSVFIAGAAVVVQHLIDFEARLARVEHAGEQQATRIIETISAGFAKTNEATELFSLLERSALRTNTVAKLVRHATLIDSRLDPLISRFAQAEINRLSQSLKELGDGGSVVYEGEDRDWLLTLAREATTSLDAVSLTTVDASGYGWVDGGFWTSDLGQRYLEAQRDAVRRNVEIRRVFVLHGAQSSSLDGDVATVCRLHHDIGVKVRVLDPASTPELLKGSFIDVVVFDGVVSYEMTPASLIEDKAHPRILDTRLDLRPDRVAKRARYFLDLWESGTPFP